MTPHPLTNFEIHAYQSEPRFIGVYSRDNLPDKVKDGAYAGFSAVRENLEKMSFFQKSGKTWKSQGKSEKLV